MIGVIPDQIVTEPLVEEPLVEDGHGVAGHRASPRSPSSSGTSAPAGSAVGLVRGFGLRSGALASTFAHDAHNIVVVGMDDQDMARAVARLGEIGGAWWSWRIAASRGAGAADRRAHLGRAARRGGRGQPRLHRGGGKLGCTLPSPFQTMAFLALSVIPSLKITDHGLVDVDRFELVPLEA